MCTFWCLATSVVSLIIPHVHLPGQHFPTACHFMTHISSNYDASPNTLNPFCYHTELADNDTYTFKDMLTKPDKNKCLKLWR